MGRGVSPEGTEVGSEGVQSHPGDIIKGRGGQGDSVVGRNAKWIKTLGSELIRLENRAECPSHILHPDNLQMVLLISATRVFEAYILNIRYSFVKHPSKSRGYSA